MRGRLKRRRQALPQKSRDYGQSRKRTHRLRPFLGTKDIGPEILARRIHRPRLTFGLRRDHFSRAREKLLRFLAVWDDGRSAPRHGPHMLGTCPQSIGTAMSSVTASAVVRQIESLFDGSSVVGLSDRQLIERFTASRDAAGEAAFTALVTRHGPMVMDICRQLLGDLHDAEDAFQAVFLVLARRAPSIRDPDLLANWLFGVALRTARQAKSRSVRPHSKAEGNAMPGPRTLAGVRVEPTDQPADCSLIAREQAEALYHEIDCLPRPFRRTIVLHYFEGLTLEETAAGFAARPAPCVAAWHGRAKSCGADSRGAASRFQRRPLHRSSRRDRPRRAFR